MIKYEDRVDALIFRFKYYIEKRRVRLVTATKNDTENTRIIRMEITRKQTLEEKQLTSDISLEKTWTWLKKENLEKKSKSLLIAAQNNAKRTNHIK